MTMWANPNSPTHGTKNTLIGHARRSSGSAQGQWKKGDIMFARESDALRAISNSYGLTVARKLATNDVDVTGKLTAFADVEIHGRLIVNGKQLKRRQLTDENDTLLQQIMDKVAALEAKNAQLKRRQLTDEKGTLLQQIMDKVVALEAKNAALERRLADAGM